MDTLKKQIIDFLNNQKKKSFLISPQEHDYFFSRPHTTPPPSISKTPHKTTPTPNIHHLINQALPHIIIKTEIPQDTLAKQKASAWKNPYSSATVVILFFDEVDQKLLLLQKLKDAIDSTLAPAILLEGRSLEKEQKWEALLNMQNIRLILSPPFEFWQKTTLASFYHKDPSSNSHFLQNTPLLLMEPAENYLTNPDIKRKLWKTLTLQLSSLT
jgi:hypothetical protein